jgi:hypothetical protein
MAALIRTFEILETGASFRTKPRQCTVDNLRVSAASLKVNDADSKLFVVTLNDLRAPASAQCAQVCLFQLPNARTFAQQKNVPVSDSLSCHSEEAGRRHGSRLKQNDALLCL